MSDYTPNSPPPEERPLVRLTDNDWRYIEAEVIRELENLSPAPSLEDEIQRDLQMLGAPPTLEALKQQGYKENEGLINVLSAISSFGRITTLLVAEAIQSLAAVIIAIVFAILEFWRVHGGAIALGQPENQAYLIAFAVVTANIVHPIYTLRELRGQQNLTVTHMTMRGYLESFWHLLFFKPTTKEVGLYHNPVLHIAASVITWATIVIAVYDILGPLMTSYFDGTLIKPAPIALMELVMGSGLSIAGVFFVQAAAHEIGVRTLSDQPTRLIDILKPMLDERAALEATIREAARIRVDEAEKARHQQAVDIRHDTRLRYEKIKAQQLAKQEKLTQEPLPLSKAPAPIPNGNGFHHTNGNGNGHHPQS